MLYLKDSAAIFFLRYLHSEVNDHLISFSVLLPSQQKIFIKYIMLAGVNDEEEHAHQLGKLLDTFQVVSFLCIPC